MVNGMKVIDIHRHFWQSTWWPESVMRQFALIASRKTFPHPDVEDLMPHIRNARVTDPDATKIIQEMDYLGTDVSILHHMDFGMMFKGEDAPSSLEEINKTHCDVAKKYPGRVFALIGLDPRRPGGLQLFEKGVTEWGAVGLNFNPNFGYYPDDPVCHPYYNKCLELDVPLDIHVGYQHWPAGRSKYGAQPMPHMDDLTADFPDLVVVMNHSGMDTRASTYVWEQCVSIAETRMNVYLEVADWPRRLVRVMDDIPELMRKLKIMKDAVGAHRIIFGTDQPGISKQDDALTKTFIELLVDLPARGKKYGVDFSKEEVELMMYGNAERIFNRMKS